MTRDKVADALMLAGAEITAADAASDWRVRYNALLAAASRLDTAAGWLREEARQVRAFGEADDEE